MAERGTAAAGVPRNARAAPSTHVAVVGAGVGGLVAALLLASRGLRVTLVERAPAPGGKMRQVLAGGQPVDSGPTVFTLRWVFEQIFAAAGSSLDAELRITPLAVLARHHWAGAAGARGPLDLHADLQRSADAIGRFSSAAEARRFLGFCSEARRVYRTLEGPYIRSARPSFGRMVADLGPRGLAQLAALGPFASLWRTLGRHFHDPRLRQLFGRYATYCGSSPWDAPATLMLIAAVELDGVWSVDGGLHQVARTLAALAQRRGATLRYGLHCEEIVVRGGRAAGLRLRHADGSAETLAADAVVFNGDAAALAAGLLGAGARHAAAPVPRAERSLSAVTWSLHAPASGVELARHNVFFNDDYGAEFRSIRRGRLPADATVYLCAQDRDLAQHVVAAGAAERLLCLVNAPATGDQASWDRAQGDGAGGAAAISEVDACERNGFALMNRCGLKLAPAPQATVRTTPREFNALFPGTGGALYGRATQGWMALFRRPGAASRLPGLYLAGGSVHPGPGVPMAAMSGQLAAATLLAHLGSTSRSQRVVISGGTSMRSPTTAGTA